MTETRSQREFPRSSIAGAKGMCALRLGYDGVLCCSSRQSERDALPESRDEIDSICCSGNNGSKSSVGGGVRLQINQRSKSIVRLTSTLGQCLRQQISV